ncbi:DUF1007 family protein [Phocoenobacter skyensis]|uniref:ABC-type uncharacterized transport system, substrate-binding protein n=1 Tax=Phocoenobacter skyensis TaxID=97481 RepID=A0A1H8A3B3_9PAST|nr:DUF1007 family protein [Pasteurella skyensis]MDP8080385.1 DUF1007 family protein [Pasteurella skyensis]MDP8086375.1 DUF1007 family protein [Pasteurella skyensis]MDP8171214.1 DUF1007 family protein [Pasteurella skyensis]MDP8175467.1 DUF1007 family protein [Pasteurella skyensis]MDP8184035.1 DUF1007 family protein [Pasteurella skyensis]
MKKILILLTFSFISIICSAHPHSWIDMKNNVLIEEGKLIGFQMEWTLDEMASSSLIYEMKVSENKLETRKEITKDMQNTAISNHYFSYLYDENNQPIKYTTKPKNTYFEIKNNQVIFHITFYLTNPQEVKNRRFKLFTYEPSYYISMNYEDSNALLLSDVDRLCKLELKKPQINADLKEYASNLDKSDNPDENLSLGAQFAQEVAIICKK